MCVGCVWQFKCEGKNIARPVRPANVLNKTMSNLFLRQMTEQLKVLVRVKCPFLLHLFAAIIGVLAFVSQPAQAANTGTWTPSGTGGSAVAGGVTVTIAGVQGSAAATNTMNATNFWTNPYGGGAVNNTPSILMVAKPFGQNQTITVTFSKPVDNPVIHFDRIGGTAGPSANQVATTVWDLTGKVSTSATVTPSLLASANATFQFSGTTWQHDTVPTIATTECAANNSSAACGSVLFTGTGITSLTFAITWAGVSNNGTGDGFEIVVSLPDPSLTLLKTVTNDNGGTLTASTVTLTATGPTTITGLSGSAAVTNATGQVGSYVLTESNPAGYAAGAWSCNSGTLVGSTVSVVAGQLATCTINDNDIAPKLTLTKISNGGFGAFTFNSVAPSNGFASQTITTTASGGSGVAGATQTLTSAATATTITETIPPGYALASAACSGMGTGGTATPNLATGALVLNAAATALGANIACTFTNTKLPTVAVTKISNGGFGAFTFNSAGPSNGFANQTITTTASGGSGVAGSAQTLTAAATTTTITETIPSGYALASATCSGMGTGGTATPNLATGALVLDAAATAAGSTIACTFTNTKLPTLAVTKISNGGVGGFTFNSAGASNGFASQTITTATSGTGVSGATQTLTAASTATRITETIPSGYALSNIVCSGAGVGNTTNNLVSGFVDIAPAGTVAGSTINCTFTNDKLPVLTLAKTVTNDNGGTLAVNTVNLTATGPSTVTGIMGAAAVTNAQVPIGTYALSEANPTGYLAGAWSCTAGTLAGSNLTLVAGQVATCTINNNDIQPKLTLIKTVTNDNGGTSAVSAFTLQAVNGATTISGASGTAAVTNAAADAGTWALSETGPAGYTQGAWICTAGTLAGSNLTLAPGDTATCTINNNDISPKLTLVKQVVNDNGGTLLANTVNLTASGPTPITGVTGAAAVNAANVNAGTYTLTEAATPGYTQGAWSCTAGTLTVNSLVLALNQNATCTIINNDTAPVLTLVKTITNDNGGTILANTVSLSATGPVSIAGVTGAGAVTSAAVNAGTYTLSEANPTGYAAGAWSCTVGTLTGNSLVLALGQTSTCTINDNDISPVLTLIKTVTNDSGGTILASSVNLTATGPTTITGASGSGTITNASVNPGSYALSEANPAGYSASSWSCTAGTLTGSSLALTLGQTATCTINDNDISPILTLVKTVTNDDAGTLAANAVALTATGPTTITGNLGAGAITNAAVNAGIYALSEVNPAGYAAGAWSCTGGTLSGSNLTLAPGQTATCTINNNDIAPKLTLVKTVTNDDGGTAAASAFPLTAAGPVTITGATAAAAVTNANVKVGSYTLSETGPAGYAAGAWSCTGGSLSGSTLTLAAGDVASCSINNDDVAPILTLVKTVTNDNGGTVAANTVSLSAVGPVSITGMTGDTAILNRSVKAGSYVLSEVNPAGYAAGSWSCTGGTLAGSNLTLTPGQIATCTINDNDISPILTLSKTVTNDNGGIAAVSAFTLTATGPTTVSGINGAIAVTTANVNAGVYALSETGPSGYTAGAWSCSAGTLAGSSLTLTLGETAVCAINNNDDPAKLTLVKTLTNDNGGSSLVSDFTLKATGPTTVSGITAAAAVTNATVNAGTYALSETGPTGYLAGAWSCTSGTLTGSSLALGSGETATCTVNNNDIAPKLTLVKTLTNDNGGVSVVADFTLTATGPSTITGLTGAAAITNAAVTAGSYALSESGPTGYLAGAWNCSSGTLVGSTLTLALNQTATCTINNNDISPKLTLVKTITNNSGGSNVVADFILKATGPTTIIGATGSASVTNANVNVGTYALSETGPSVYTAGLWNCSAGSLAGSNLTLALNQSATCTLNNDDTPATITLNKISNGGVGTFAFNGGNGVGAQSITTTTAGTSVATSPITFTNSSTATTITETIPTGYGLTAASCTGLGVGTATPNLLTGVLALDAAATAPGNAVNCTFTNGKASFTVAKSASPSSITAPGPVTYTITVVNTGLADLTSPVLSDTLTQGATPKTLSSGPTLVTGDLVSPGVLNVGETWTYTASYNVTQGDIDSGTTISNSATFDTLQTAPSTSNPATTTIGQLPGLTVTKSSTTPSFTAVGDPISYSYVVRNSGNVTVTSAISVSDDKAIVSCPALTGGILAPNDTITCTATYLVTQVDIDAGGVTNTASADTTFGGSPVASPTVSKTVPAIKTPNMTVNKVATSVAFINPGDAVTYKYTITNTGNTTLNAPFLINDNLIPSASINCIGSTIAPSGSIDCTGTYNITQDDLDLGRVTNVATATSGGVTSPQTSVTVPIGIAPALSITKATAPAIATFAAVGDTVTYNYVVTNTGSATLTRLITVIDDKIGTISCHTPPPNFIPTATQSCSAIYAVTQADLDLGFVTNQATANTTFGGGNIPVVSPPANATANAVQNPQLTVTKTVSPATITGLGQILTYTIQVQNTGNVTITNTNVTDPLIPSLACNIATLAPTASDSTCTGTYTITQADVDAGTIDNIATANGVAPQGGGVTGIGSKTVIIPQVKTLSIAKALASNADQDTSSTITLGDTLTYNVTATNTGTVTQTNVLVSDSKIAPSSKTCAILAPNSTCILIGTYTVTQTDVNAGTIGNTGSVNSTSNPIPLTTTVNTPVANSSVLTVVKVMTGYTDNDATISLTVGDTMAFSVTATNSGTVTQNNVVVTDAKLTPNSNTCATLAPNATCVLSGSHVVTAAEATAGLVANTGSVTSTLISTPATATVTTPVTRIITATNDTPIATNGASGNANLINAYTNDTLDGLAATPANVTGTVLTPATPINGNPVPSLNVSTGIVSVPAGTPAGSYTIHYQICEIASPTNCAVADITVPVTAAPVVATPDTVGGVNGASGATSVTNAFNGDTINSNPATPANSTLTVVTPVPSQLTFDPATGNVDVLPGTPAGPYTFDYKICEKLNPTNCQTTTVTVNVVAATLVATDDAPASTNGANGNPTLIDAYANDTLNSVPVSTGTIAGTIITPATPIGGGLVPVMDPATGLVSVPAGTPAGTYTITYQICEKINPVSNCKTAIVTVPVTAAPILATNDTPAAINGATGATTPTVLTNDTFNGLPIVPAAITLTPGTAPTPVAGSITMNNDGTITVAPGTTAGSYPYTYKICENLNPLNCSTATATVVVNAALIVATNDTPPNVNGATGNPSVVNALTNDMLNGVTVVPANVNTSVTTPATSIGGGPVPALNTITGNVSVPAGTPAGTYTITYEICEMLNPANCASADVTITVDAAPIVATADTPTATNGATGNTNLVNAYNNDTLNGTSLTTPALVNTIVGTITTPATPLSAGALVPIMDPTTGDVSVPAGTPAGTYTIAYDICEKLNPTNCASSTVTVPVTAAPIVATDDSPAATNGATGNAALVNAFTNDSLNGAAIIVNAINATVLTPATPAIAGANVPMLDPATGLVSVPAGTPAGTYTINYQICEKLNPANCATATVTIPVTAALIFADLDTPAALNGASGGTTPTVLANDKLNGLAVVPNDITLTPGTAPAPTAGSITMNSDGTITIAAGTTAGTYMYPYTICEKLNPTNCSNSIATVIVSAAPIVALADAPPNVNGATGNPTLVDAYANDTLNGVPVTPSTITGSVTTPATSIGGAPVPALDPLTGNVAVPSGTPAGTYSIAYKICEILNPANCANSTVTVVVDPSPIVATADTVSGINGATGASNVVNAFTGDQINGAPATTANSILSLASGSTVPTGLVFDPATGNVSVNSGTAAGSYTFNYQICEKLNPANCKIASITVDVIAAPILASNDMPLPVNGATGSTNVVNAYTNDSLNGASATPSNVKGTVITPATPVSVGAPVPELDPATGIVSVPAGTPSGTYTIAYKICELLNPTNCSNATVSIAVTAAPIVANNDFAPSTNGLVGNTSVDNAYTNDLLNGVAVVPANIIGSVLNPATPLSFGAPVPAFDPATGNVSVPAGTPAGSYTIQYKICEKLNPTNCAIADIAIPVAAAQIVALDDTPAPVNGATGNPTVTNAFTNDTLNSSAVVPANITGTVLTPATPASVGASVPLLDPATGNVAVPADTPAGTYTIHYQICENLNPTNCAVADVIIVVVASPIVATNDSVSGINGATGAANVLNAFASDTINGFAATPTNATLSVSSAVPPQLTFNVATGNVGVVSGTPIGTYTFDYQICEKLNPTNCKIATESVTVAAAVIAALPDAPPAVNGATGNPSVVDAYANDKLNGVPVTLTNITGTVLIPATPATVGAPVPALDPSTGTVSVPPNTPAGAYTITYQICENLNPSNCSMSTIQVLVDPSPIVVTADVATVPNGIAGTLAVLNVFTGDTVNNVAATNINAILTVASGSSVPSVLVFDPATGNVDVKSGTPAGAYSFDYQICEKINPANCKTTSVTVNVGAAPLLAVDDTVNNINGASGATSVLNAFTGDTLNGLPATISNATLALAPGETVPSGLVFNLATGNVDVNPATPAGAYTFKYQICEILNPTNCKIATITVNVGAAPIIATNDSATGINGASGAAAVVNALTSDTLNSAPASLANVNLSLATGSTVPAQLVFDSATGNVDVKPGTAAGTYSFDYQICEKLNPTNCKTATILVTTIVGPVVASPDTISGINGTSGATAVLNAFTGDTINGATATPTNSTITVATGSTVPSQLIFDPATGSVDVKPNTPAGPYTFNYQICENLNPGNCQTAAITVNVVGGPVVAVDDSTTGINGASGAIGVINAYTSDTINGVVATSGNSTISLAVGSTVPPELVFSTATGAVDVKPGTPIGTYTFNYTICENLNPTNCATATETVVVAAAAIAANPDMPANVNGATGNPSLANAYTNDLLNGVPATPATITGAVITPAASIGGGPVPVLAPSTGIVSVPPGTPAGTYTIAYKICEQLNPTNCASSTVTVIVDPAPVVATSDTGSGFNGANGAPAALNAFTSDTINGAPATPANSTVVLASGSTVPPQLVFTPATGTVDVKPNTPIGTYSFDYTLCEILNPTNCKTATETVNVIAAPLVATNDNPPNVNGATGNPALVNAFTNDTFNTAPVDLTKVTATITTPAVPATLGAPVPALDPATGDVAVPPGTPSGTYTVIYQLCENLNPVANCKTAVVTVVVDAAPLVATNDSTTGINGATGATAVVNALTGDTINSAAATTANSILTVATGSTVPAQLVFDPATGNVDVKPGTPAGTYSFDYQICEKLNPTNCKTATISVTTIASPIIAANDTATGINGASGVTAVTNALNGDFINGVAATPANATLTVATGSTVPVQLVFNPVTGTVDVVAGTPAGTYSFDYQICETLNPSNCKIATVSVTTVASPISATNDTATNVNGATGVPAVVNVLSGDLINGVAATPANSILSIPTGSSVPPQLAFNPATGAVDVLPNTPAGTYTFDYQICEKLNPTNCTTATVSITVTPSPLLATNDSASGINGATGALAATNAFNGDLINGVAATPANAILSVATGSTVPAQLTFNPATGSVDVSPATPAGVYTFNYQICEKINPTNCQIATESITVIPPPILAMNDSPATVFDTKFALTNVVNVLANDTLNGVAVTPASVTLAPVGVLPAGVTLNPDGSVDLAQYLPSGTYTFDYTICEIVNPTNCKTATVKINVKKTVPAVSGTVFFDTNGDGLLDAGEAPLSGYIVQLVRGGVVVDQTLSGIDGTYSIFGFPPNTGYQLLFIDPATGVTVGAITGLDFTNSTILTNQNEPIDPSGVIYDSVTGAPVAGAVVTMTTAGGTPLPAACLLPGQQNQTTLVNGQYRFDIVAGAAPQCPAGQTEYRLAIVSPANYLPVPSTNIAPQAGPLNANACAVAPAACLVSPSPTAPPVAAPTPYYLAFLLQAGSPNVINNHIPIDPILAGTATFTKTALKTEVHRGERVPYVIQAAAMNFTKANVVDIIPPGFDYVLGSALVNGVAATPTINGNELTFSNITATAGALKIELTLIANAAVQPGAATNKAKLFNFFTGNIVSNARATVTVVVDPVFDCGEIIGRVFEDANRNGYQDDGEEGLAGVRIATVKGVLVTTDKFGRFHVSCADIPDHDIGSNFVMKLDTRTLPTGYRLTTENPRDVRLTAGKMTKLNFGASIAHLVDLDLNGKVFKSGSTELLQEWRSGLATLIAKLDEEPSTLRLTYHSETEPTALASKRLNAVSALITSLWNKVEGRYQLPIETRSVDAKGGNQ